MFAKIWWPEIVKQSAAFRFYPLTCQLAKDVSCNPEVNQHSRLGLSNGQLQSHSLPSHSWETWSGRESLLCSKKHNYQRASPCRNLLENLWVYGCAQRKRWLFLWTACNITGASCQFYVLLSVHCSLIDNFGAQHWLWRSRGSQEMELQRLVTLDDG